MTAHPVSVIIPTYNRKHFLPRALDSIFRQTHKCFEVIIVDDGSTDSTEQYVRGLKYQHKCNIRYLRQENKGPAAARNLGIVHSESDYVAFLDSDDHWHKRKLEKQCSLLLNSPQFLISHTKEKWLRNGIHLNQKKKHIPQHGDIFSHCLELCAVGMSTVMVHKLLFEHVGLFDESFRCCEDYDFWLRASCRHQFLLVDSPLTIKEGGREDQVSQQFSVGMDKLRIRSIENLLASRKLQTDQYILACNELVKKYTIYGNGCLRHGKEDEGLYYLGKAESLNDQIPKSSR
ncbi:glycosyltransferase family 2 protein [Desulfosediminicola flagellatus]|uniref:glycosyltransferase family 2 protein n=1 Tax=Desulfosediminicola flagellatus TaxID=2569541 RepID=UPI0010ACFE4F|nr:glycosyltransferase family A protein [Desulfosediminicola flagellatus]